jgi:hypothetical protein
VGLSVSLPVHLYQKDPSLQIAADAHRHEDGQAPYDE